MGGSYVIVSSIRATSSKSGYQITSGYDSVILSLSITTQPCRQREAAMRNVIDSILVFRVSDLTIVRGQRTIRGAYQWY